MLPSGKRVSALVVVVCAIIIGIGFAGAAVVHSTKPLKSSAKTKSEATSAASKRASVAPRTDRAAIAKKYAALPLSFEPNVGLAPSSVDFVSHGANYTVLLAADRVAVETVQELVSQDPVLRKMDAKTLRKFERTKYFRSSLRFRKLRKAQHLTIGLAGAKASAQAEPLQELPGRASYFIGNDPAEWRTGVATYARVRYKGVYPGIDLLYYGSQRQIEFDFIVSPGANPSSISLSLSAPNHFSINKNGDLLTAPSKNSLVLKRPAIYQVLNGKRRAVQGGYRVDRGGRVGISVAEYDRTKPLIIDPTLAYSTYLGGSDFDEANDIAVDANGNAYIAGDTQSLNFPTVNAYSTTGNVNSIAFVSKLDPTGTTLLYSTYLGGSVAETGLELALDSSNNVYLVGNTASTDFPVVNGFQTSLASSVENGFVARIDTTQSGTASLVYSTYLGGGGNASEPGYGDFAAAIAVDSSGLAYVTGQTTSDNSVTPFPTTSTAYQSSLSSTNGNAFLTVIDSNQAGSASLVYSTYLGGDGAGYLGDYGSDVAVDNSGDAYLAGQTTSDGSGPFPVTSTAYQSSLNSPNGNVFIAEISTTQSGSQSLLYSTYFGGSTTNSIGDSGTGMAIDSSGKVYVVGEALSSDFPVTSGAFQTSNSNPEGVAFISKFDLSQSGSQSLVYSTFLGGTDGWEGDFANSVAVDSNGNAFLTGEATSDNFPTTAGSYQSSVGSSGDSAFLSELNSSGSALLYSTYLGGSCDISGFALTLDSLANPYLVGYTCDTDFPISPSTAYQTSLGGNYDGYITKFALNPNPGIVASESPQPNASGWNNSSVTVSFTCIPGGAPLSSCTSPDALTTEGASQSVTGTAEDTASNTATATATVNIDLTAPSLSVTVPSSSSVTVSTPYIAISGTISDALSGVAGVTCNGAPATVASTSFSCTVPLSTVSNTVEVVGFDVAGNTTTTDLSVTVSMSTPTSLTVTPPTPNMTVGGTQAFTAVDQTGTPRPDATWSISDTTVASFESASPNTLLGNAAGTATVTATIGSVTGTTTVTVLSGAPSVGTVLWSAPGDGSGIYSYGLAMPLASVGANVFMAQNSGSVQGLSSDGAVLWTSSALSGADYIQPDAIGGVLGVSSTTITALEPVAGQQTWTYTASGIDENSLAIGMDDTIYYENTSSSPISVVGLDGTTGTVKFTVALETGTNSSTDTCDNPTGAYSENTGSTAGPLTVAADGSAYLIYDVGSSAFSENLSTCSNTTTSSNTLKVLQIAPGGAATSSVLHNWTATSSSTYTTNAEDQPVLDITSEPQNTAAPGQVIPTDQNGLAFAWVETSPVYTSFCEIIEMPPYDTSCTDTVPGTTQKTISTTENGSISNEFAVPNNDTPYSMLVGQNQQLFVAAQNSSTSASTLYAETFGGSLEWSSSGAYNLDLSTQDGGLIASLNSGAGSQELISFDTSGSSTAQPMGVYSPWQTWAGGWMGISSSGALNSVAANYVSVSNDNYQAQAFGNPSATGAATNQPWFPPLSSCPGATTPCAQQAFDSALNALRALIAGTCTGCDTYVFTPARIPFLKSKANLLNFISQPPFVFDGADSKLPVNEFECRKGHSCPYSGYTEPISRFMTDTESSAISQTPSQFGKIVAAFAPSAFSLSGPGTPGALLNEALIFHEALHGATGLMDIGAPSLQDVFGIPYEYPSEEITVCLDDLVLGGSAMPTCPSQN